MSVDAKDSPIWLYDTAARRVVSVNVYFNVTHWNLHKEHLDTSGTFICLARDVIHVKPNPFYGRPILFRGFRAVELIHWIMEICQAVCFYDCFEYTKRVNISISRINSIATAGLFIALTTFALKPVSREPRNIQRVSKRKLKGVFYIYT